MPPTNSLDQHMYHNTRIVISFLPFLLACFLSFFSLRPATDVDSDIVRRGCLLSKKVSNLGCGMGGLTMALLARIFCGDSSPDLQFASLYLSLSLRFAPHWPAYSVTSAQ